MKAIRTRYSPPTNTRGARILASDGDGNKTFLNYPHELNNEKAHAAAAKKLCKKMNWNLPMIGGQYDHDFYFVFVEPEEWKQA